LLFLALFLAFAASAKAQNVTVLSTPTTTMLTAHTLAARDRLAQHILCDSYFSFNFSFCPTARLFGVPDLGDSPEGRASPSISATTPTPMGAVSDKTCSGTLD
jgi:hypothetical protein